MLYLFCLAIAIVRRWAEQLGRTVMDLVAVAMVAMFVLLWWGFTTFADRKRGE